MCANGLWGPLDQVWGDGGWRVDAPLGAGTSALVLALALPTPVMLSPWTLCRKEREGAGFSRSLFQVWVIADKVQGSHSLSRGTVCRRTGVQSLEPAGRAGITGIGEQALGGRCWPGFPGAQGLGGPWAEPRGTDPWRESLCPLTPMPWVIPFSSPRGLGSPSIRATTRAPESSSQKPASSRMGSSRAWPMAHGETPGPVCC